MPGSSEVSQSMEHTFDYPVDFVEQVMQTFPDADELYEALKKGNLPFVGDYLRKFTLSPEEIIGVAGGGQQEAAFKAAGQVMKAQELLREWEKFYMVYNQDDHSG